jgi:hypothetical protein
MTTIAEVDECVAREFGSLLEPHAFRPVGKRKWVCSSRAPIRYLVRIGALKGATYCPIWGISSGVVPTIKGKRFRPQTTDRNAVMDLIIDPVDREGTVPPESFAFLAGVETEVPVEAIRRCAAHFVPVALDHFDRARNLPEFSQFFLERSQLQYRRFGFDMYTQHRISRGFLSLLEGREAEGLDLIRTFCAEEGLDQNDPVLQESLAAARRAAQ